ncbi:MAG: LPS assembly protein LptD [Syntrophotaleaceae bacterium]
MNTRALTWGQMLALLVCLTGIALPASAENGIRAQSLPVEIEADQLTYDEDSSTYLAERDVLLRRGEDILQAEEVRWNEQTNRAAAYGDVRLAGPDGVATGTEMQLDLAEGTGIIRNGHVLIRKDNFHIYGDEIEKTGEDTYRVADGTFTTCDGEVPSWKFTASEVDVTLEGFAWAKNVFFHINDLPVLYLPIFGYPVQTERQSGLLTPSVGYSDKGGSELSLAYYQVIDRNMDATFYLDYLSRLGVGKGLEFRYFFGHDNEGEAKIYHVSGLSGEDDRFALGWQHLGTLPADVRLIADVTYVSEKDYFSDFGEAAGEYNLDTAESLLAASRNWGKNNLAGQVRYVKDLRDNEDLVLQRLPDVRFAVIRQRIGDTPLYYRLDSEAAYLYEDNNPQDENREGGRFALRPALSAVFHPGGVMDLVSEVAYLGRFYSGHFGEEAEGAIDFSTRLASRFSRVYAVDGDRIRKIQHVVQPEIGYRYSPADIFTDLPGMTVEDFAGRQHVTTVGVTNRLIARLASAEGQVDTHEFLYLRLAQEFNLDASGKNLLVPGQSPSVDHLRLELIVRPTRRTFFDVDTRYDVTSGEDFLDFNAATGIRDAQGNSLSLSYRYEKDDHEYLGAGVRTSWLKPVYVGYSHRYSVDGSEELEKVLDIEYRAQCWSVFLLWRDRREDQEISINFSLSGLGRVWGWGGSLGP